MPRLPGLRASARHSAGRSQIAPRLRPLVLDLGCCGMSALQLAAPTYALPGDDGRWYDLAPSQANVLIVAGRITPACSALVEALYSQMAAPRWVIACGACAASGTLLDTVPASDLLPVDLEVPGCPPHPDNLYHALARLSVRRCP